MDQQRLAPHTPGADSVRPLLTILIVNRNAASYLRECLRSILATAGEIPTELVLVDGDSTDDSVQVARALWPEVKVIPVSANLGYVRGNNVGLEAATGKYTMYLNSDTVIYADALQLLLQFMETHPQVGIASGSILNPDGTDQGVVRMFPSVMNGIFGRRSWLSRMFPNNRWYRQYMQSRREQSLEPFKTEIMSACSMIAPTALLQELGGFDERFRFYWVDAELCGRIARRGREVYCVPRARIMHHEGKGSSTSTFKKRLEMNAAFNRGAYLAYVEYHQLGPLNPLRLVVRAILTVRMLLLTGLLFLRPSHATSSGGAN